MSEISCEYSPNLSLKRPYKNHKKLRTAFCFTDVFFCGFLRLERWNFEAQKHGFDRVDYVWYRNPAASVPDMFHVQARLAQMLGMLNMFQAFLYFFLLMDVSWRCHDDIMIYNDTSWYIMILYLYAVDMITVDNGCISQAQWKRTWWYLDVFGVSPNTGARFSGSCLNLPCHRVRSDLCGQTLFREPVWPTQPQPKQLRKKWCVQKGIAIGKNTYA